MFTQKNVLRVYVGRAANATNNATLVDSATDINDGEVVAIDMSTNATATNLAAVNSWRLAYRNGTELFYSPVIKTANIKKAYTRGYTAGQEQITYVGSNGTTGAFQLANSASYVLNIQMIDPFKTFGNKQMYKQLIYVSDAAATQGEIAFGLLENALASFKNEPDEMIRFGVVNSDAGAATGAVADTVVGTIGTNTVTITDVGGDNSVSPIAAGDLFRVGTTVTSPVYLVTASTVGAGGGTLTLSTPLQQSVNLLGTTSEFITAANALAANYGLSMTGVARTNFIPGIFKYFKYRFKVALVVGGLASTTPITYSQIAREGQGVAPQIAELEWFAAGNSYNYGKRVLEPGDKTYVPATDLVVPGTYESIVLHVVDDNDVATVTGASPKSSHEIIIACLKDSVWGDAFVTTLNTTLPANMQLAVFPA